LVTKKFIKDLSQFLNKDGKAYFIFSSHSSRSILEKQIVTQGFHYKIVSSKRYDDEILDVYCINL